MTPKELAAFLHPKLADMSNEMEFFTRFAAELGPKGLGRLHAFTGVFGSPLGHLLIEMQKTTDAQEERSWK